VLVRYAYRADEVPLLRSMVSRPHETVTEQKLCPRGVNGTSAERLHPFEPARERNHLVGTCVQEGCSNFEHPRVCAARLPLHGFR
jgi:hypothetical protein